IACFADVVGWLEDNLCAVFTGNFSRAILAVIINDDDFGCAAAFAFVDSRRAFQRIDRTANALLLVPRRNDDRERRLAHLAGGFSASSINITGLPSRTGYRSPHS